MKKLENKLVKFITENKESFYRLAYSYVRNEEDALDIVQESIHKALLSVDRLSDPKAMKSWFYRIVANTSLDFLRKRKKVDIVDPEMIELKSPGENDVYENIDLQQSVNELPIKYREVIVLRYFEDMTIEEAANILNQNVNTVKTRLYQALRLLKVKMVDETMKEEK